MGTLHYGGQLRAAGRAGPGRRDGAQSAPNLGAVAPGSSAPG